MAPTRVIERAEVERRLLDDERVLERPVRRRRDAG
jgi:hypothetical protein